MKHLQGYKGQNKALWSIILYQQGLLTQNSRGKQSQGREPEKAARMMCFQGKCIPCRFIKQISPFLACQEIYKGLTVAPHGDGFFLKESRIQRVDLWCRPGACCFTHPFLSLAQLPQYEEITSAKGFSQQTTCPY